jgi:hypothetical protein
MNVDIGSWNYKTDFILFINIINTMNKILNKLISKDICGIVIKYLLPSRDLCKAKYNNINMSGYSCIKSQYVYFSLKKHYKFKKFYDINNCGRILMEFYNDNIKINKDIFNQYCYFGINYIDLYMNMNDLTYSDKIEYLKLKN